MDNILKKTLESQNAFYDSCGFSVKNLIPEKESAEYYAHTYSLENKYVSFRIAKKTPTKAGWFVTMWKRKADGIIAPYDKFDPIDFFVINIVNENKFGQFVFPKSVLLEKKIFSTEDIEGKRAIRVYTPWDETTNKQATQTQKWQLQYFVDITSKHSENIQTFKDLYMA